MYFHCMNALLLSLRQLIPKRKQASKSNTMKSIMRKREKRQYAANVKAEVHRRRDVKEKHQRVRMTHKTVYFGEPTGN